MDDKPSILEISPLFMLLLSYFAANSQPDCAPSRLPCLAAGARSPIVSLRTLFTDHPATVGETYWQHLGGAWGFSWRLMAASLACLIHARSEEHTSELPSLMRISYAVFCLKKQNTANIT